MHSSQNLHKPRRSLCMLPISSGIHVVLNQLLSRCLVEAALIHRFFHSLRTHSKQPAVKDSRGKNRRSQPDAPFVVLSLLSLFRSACLQYLCWSILGARGTVRLRVLPHRNGQVDQHRAITELAPSFTRNGQ